MTMVATTAHSGPLISAFLSSQGSHFHFSTYSFVAVCVRACVRSWVHIITTNETVLFCCCVYAGGFRGSTQGLRWRKIEVGFLHFHLDLLC